MCRQQSDLFVPYRHSKMVSDQNRKKESRERGQELGGGGGGGGAVSHALKQNLRLKKHLTAAASSLMLLKSWSARDRPRCSPVVFAPWKNRPCRKGGEGGWAFRLCGPGESAGLIPSLSSLTWMGRSTGRFVNRAPRHLRPIHTCWQTAQQVASEPPALSGCLTRKTTVEHDMLATWVDYIYIYV